MSDIDKIVAEAQRYIDNHDPTELTPIVESLLTVLAELRRSPAACTWPRSRRFSPTRAVIALPLSDSPEPPPNFGNDPISLAMKAATQGECGKCILLEQERDDLKAKLKRAREALEKYGRHIGTGDCWIGLNSHGGTPECSCGYDDTLRDIEAGK